MSDTRDVKDPADPPVDAPSASSAGFEALWQRVLDHWDDDKAHAALIELALHTEQLPEAAGRYRALKADPAKTEGAQKRLDAIVVVATQLMMSMKTPSETKVPLPITLSAVGIFLFALCAVAYMFIHR